LVPLDHGHRPILCSVHDKEWRRGGCLYGLGASLEASYYCVGLTQENGHTPG
jgi:hypothetical protein